MIDGDPLADQEPPVGDTLVVQDTDAESVLFREGILDADGDAVVVGLIVVRADTEALGVTRTVCDCLEDCERDADS